MRSLSLAENVLVLLSLLSSSSVLFQAVAWLIRLIVAGTKITTTMRVDESNMGMAGMAFYLKR